MAETVGRVEIIADVDGRDLDRQLRNLGNSAGKQLGKTMSDAAAKEFSKLGNELRVDMRDNGELAGISFTRAMQQAIKSRLGGITDEIARAFATSNGIRNYVDQLGGVEEGSKKLRQELMELNENGILTDKMFNRLMGTLAQAQGTWRAQQREVDENKKSFDDLSRSVDGFIARQTEMELNAKLDALAIREVKTETDNVSTAFQKVRKDSDDVTRSLELQSHGWKSLPHGFRQFAFYTGLFSALAEEIAILGSAAGSSLTVLAGAAGAAGVGIGVFIAAFNDMMGEISELPAAVQPAAASLQEFVGSFSALQDVIQVVALSGAAGAFESLRSTVEALTPAFTAVADAVGRILDTFANSIAPGTAGFENLATLIAASAPVFETLANAAIVFGEALGNVFVLSIPYVEKFAGFLGQIADQFLNFTIQNADSITQFFANGQRIMESILPLVTAVADALNQLVTPATISDFADLMTTLASFTPILGQILGVIGDLNIFNLLAEALLAIGMALEPVMPLLSQTAIIISEGLSLAIMNLTPVLTSLFAALAPILPVLAQIAVDIIAMLIPAVVALTPLFAPLSEVIIQVLNAITPLLPLIADLVVQIISGLVPVLVPLIEQFAQLFVMIAPLMPLIVTLIQIALTPLTIVFEAVLPILGALISLFSAFFAPVQALLKPVVDLIGGWDGLKGSMDSFSSQLDGFVSGVIGGIQTMIGWIEDAVNAFLGLFGLAADAPSPGGGGSGGGGGGLASGGVVTYGARRLIGEDGPEAVVPLDRPLSQVDPSVRALSAFAQGLSTGGGVSGRITNVEAGAIVIQTQAPPMQVANAVLDRLIANAAV